MLCLFLGQVVAFNFLRELSLSLAFVLIIYQKYNYQNTILFFTHQDKKTNPLQKHIKLLKLLSIHNFFFFLEKLKQTQIQFIKNNFNKTFLFLSFSNVNFGCWLVLVFIRQNRSHAKCQVKTKIFHNTP